MNIFQKTALDISRPELADIDPIDPLIEYLYMHQYITKDDRELLFLELRQKSRVWRLIDIMKTRDNGWQGLIQGLDAMHMSNLRTSLQQRCTSNACCCSEMPVATYIESLKNYYSTQFSFVYLLPESWNQQDFQFTAPVNDVWVDITWLNPTTRCVENGQRVRDNLASPGRQLCLVQGCSGTGKTTFLRKLCYEWSVQSNASSCTSNALIPLEKFHLLLCAQLRFRNKHYDTILEMCLDQLPDCTESMKSHIIEYVQKNGDNVLLLLDGLDEYQWQSCTQLDQLVHGHKMALPASILITTRPHYSSVVRIPAHVVEVYGFNQAQIKLYIRKVFGQWQQENSGELLIRNLSKSEALNGLCRIPILAHFCCLLVKNLDDNLSDIGHLPTTVTGLFLAITHMLMQHKMQLVIGDFQWSYGDDISKIDLFVKLGDMALSMLMVGPSGTMVFEPEILESYQVESAVQIGLLSHVYQPGLFSATALLKSNAPSTPKPCSPALSVSFLHKTFQEFFAAIYLTACASSKTTDSTSDVSLERLKKFLLELRDLVSYERYKYVIAFCFGLFENADVLLNAVEMWICDNAKWMRKYFYCFQTLQSLFKQVVPECRNIEVKRELTEKCANAVEQLLQWQPWYVAFWYSYFYGPHAMREILLGAARSMSQASQESHVVYEEKAFGLLISNADKIRLAFVDADTLDRDEFVAALGIRSVECLVYCGPIDKLEEVASAVDFRMLQGSANASILCITDFEGSTTLSNCISKYPQTFRTAYIFASGQHNSAAVTIAAQALMDADSTMNITLCHDGTSPLNASWLSSLRWHSMDHITRMFLLRLNMPPSDIRLLAQHFVDFPQLQMLSLFGNVIDTASEHSGTTVARNLHHLKNLWIFNVGACHLSATSVIEIMRAVANLSQQNIHFSSNETAILGSSSFPFNEFCDELGHAQGLCSLRIDKCGLRDDHVATLFDVIEKKLTSIQELWLLDSIVLPHFLRVRAGKLCNAKNCKVEVLANGTSLCSETLYVCPTCWKAPQHCCSGQQIAPTLV